MMDEVSFLVCFGDIDYIECSLPVIRANEKIYFNRELIKVVDFSPANIY